MSRRHPLAALLSAASAYADHVEAGPIRSLSLVFMSGSRHRIDPTPGRGETDDEGPPDLLTRALRALVSPDGLRILSLIGEKGPLEAKAVAAQLAPAVERSKCYTLIADMRARGLVRDEGNGYVLGEPELWRAAAETLSGEPPPLRTVG